MPIPADYKTVTERIAEFKAKHPEGCLRVADPLVPYRIETIDGRTFVVVVAAAYRTPDDPAPGIGIAWEPVPGPTNFTRDSELQNAETSAWGRAIVAVLASESKHVATSEDVRNRDEQHRVPKPFDVAGFKNHCATNGLDPLEVIAYSGVNKELGELTAEDRPALKDALAAMESPVTPTGAEVERPADDPPSADAPSQQELVKS